jgi:hypothetical protein
MRTQSTIVMVPVVAHEAYDLQPSAPESVVSPPPPAATRRTGGSTLKRATTNFGEEFKKKNKRTAQPDDPLDKPCGVTVHDYSAEKYERNSRGEIKNLAELLRELDVLKVEKPEWASVR